MRKRWRLNNREQIYSKQTRYSFHNNLLSSLTTNDLRFLQSLDFIEQRKKRRRSISQIRVLVKGKLPLIILSTRIKSKPTSYSPFFSYFLTRHNSVETSQRKRRTRIARTFLLYIRYCRRRSKRKKHAKKNDRQVYKNEKNIIATHTKKKNANAKKYERKNAMKEKRCFSVAATGEYFFLYPYDAETSSTII